MTTREQRLLEALRVARNHFTSMANDTQSGLSVMRQDAQEGANDCEAAIAAYSVEAAAEERQEAVAWRFRLIEDGPDEWVLTDTIPEFDDPSKWVSQPLYLHPSAPAEVDEARPPVAERDLYYLRSILRQLREVRVLVEGPSIPSEALADNIDWLDCFIDQHERLAARHGGKSS